MVFVPYVGRIEDKQYTLFKKILPWIAVGYLAYNVPWVIDRAQEMANQAEKLSTLERTIEGQERTAPLVEKQMPSGLMYIKNLSQ